MRSIFTFTIAVLIITACSQTSITATPTPLPSTTPTRISTVTPTFSPTFTSTPQASELTPAQIAWETHFAGTANIQEDGTIVDSVSGERIGSETDVWTYNENGTYTRKYYPSNLGGEELTVTYLPADIKIVLDENGKPTGAWDLSGWVKNEAGELMRETNAFPTKKDGVTVELEVFSKKEIKAELLQTGKTASARERVATVEIGENIHDSLFGRIRVPGNKGVFTFDGIYMPDHIGYAWGENTVVVRNEITGELEEKGSALYIVDAMGENAE